MGRTLRDEKSGEALSYEASKLAAQDRLLKAGAQILRERGPAMPSTQLNVQEVTKAAGVSVGTLYSQFESVKKFSERVVAHVCDNERYAEDFDDIANALDDGAVDALGRLAAAADTDLASLHRPDSWWPVQSNFVLASGKEDWLQELFFDLYRECDGDTSETYGRLLAEHGMAMRPPFTEVELGRLLQALVEGVGLRQLVDPEGVAPSEHSGGLGIYALGAAAILGAMCVPADAREPQSFDAWFAGQWVMDRAWDVRVVSQEDPDTWVGLQPVYESSFPDHERLPVDLMAESLAEGERVLRTGALIEQEPTGFAVTLPLTDDSVLLEYLAVDDEQRGAGIGTALMRSVLSSLNGRRLLIEVDPPSTAPSVTERKVREQRIRFYERLGAIAMPSPGVSVPVPNLGETGESEMQLLVIGAAPSLLSVSRAWEAALEKSYGLDDRAFIDRSVERLLVT